MQILNAAVRLITWQPLFLLELRAVATRYHSANAEFDPILVFWGLFCCFLTAFPSVVSPARAADGAHKFPRKPAQGICR